MYKLAFKYNIWKAMCLLKNGTTSEETSENEEEKKGEVPSS